MAVLVAGAAGGRHRHRRGRRAAGASGPRQRRDGPAGAGRHRRWSPATWPAPWRPPFALGVPAATVAARLGSLPGAPHRRSAQQGANGARIIDDTYNANPAGAKAALALLGVIGDPGGQKGRRHPGHGRARPPPGQGERQFRRRRRGRGHRARRGRPDQCPVPDGGGQGRRRARSAAPGTARRPSGGCPPTSAPLDAVLYENDLPDHYPRPAPPVAPLPVGPVSAAERPHRGRARWRLSSVGRRPSTTSAS